MSFLEKIENAINNLLFLMGNAFLRILIRVTPQKIQRFFLFLKECKSNLIQWFKNFPNLAKEKAPVILAYLKKQMIALNIKGKLQNCYQSALSKYNEGKGEKKINRIKKIVFAPLLVIGHWLNGLTTAQSVMLLGLTTTSILAAINMIFSGQRLLENHYAADRAPASVEAQISYDRPDYYKRQTRHVTITSVRLPVFFPNVNELRTVDVDFTATLSNRMSRMQVDKLELQLRDHLVLNIEPMVASFPLEEEGKEILRQKLLKEVTEFMKLREIEGEIEDLKITYVLAN